MKGESRRRRAGSDQERARRRRKHHLDQLRCVLDESHPFFPHAWSVIDQVIAGDLGHAFQLRRFLQFTQSNNVDLSSMTADQVIASLARLTHGRSTWKSYRELVEEMFESAKASGVIATNPCEDVPSGRVRAGRRRLDGKELRSLLTSLESRLDDPITGIRARRDRLFLLLWLWDRYCLSDIVRLRWRDVDLRTGRIRLSNSGHVAWATLPRVLLDALRGWEAALSAEGVDVVGEDALISTLHWRHRRTWMLNEREVLEPLTGYGVQAMLQKCFRRARLDEPIVSYQQRAVIERVRLPDGWELDDLAPPRRVLTRWVTRSADPAEGRPAAG